MWRSPGVRYRLVTPLHFSREARAQEKIFRAPLQTDPVFNATSEPRPLKTGIVGLLVAFSHGAQLSILIPC